MHNPTRRVKRFRRPLPLTAPPIQFPEVSRARLDVRDQDNPTGDFGQRTRAAQSDALRGAMLVTLIAVTIVLYIILWEPERSLLVSVQKPNLNYSGMATLSWSSMSNSLATSTRYPPTVLRDEPALSLEKGSNLTGNQMQMTVSSNVAPDLGRMTPIAWPPRITRVPEEHTEDLVEQVDDFTHKDENADVNLSPFDSVYCNNGPCHFLLPVRIGEQESKARMHFSQLLILSRRLNRTIVLPNVGKSRMSACSKWPFDAYYDTNAFVRGGDSFGSPLAVGLEQFAKWIDERPAPPSGFVISMDSAPHGRGNTLKTRGTQDAPFVIDRVKVDSKILSCLEPNLARLRSSLPETALSISIDSDSLRTESDTSSRLVHYLSTNLDIEPGFDLVMGLGYEFIPQPTSSSLSLANIEVLVVDYDLRHPLFDAQPSFDLHYAPVFYDLADRLSDGLGPFVGVHWRMESVPIQNLAWCSASLVSALHALLQDDIFGKDVRHVWLATDYPRPLSTFMDRVRFPVEDDWMLNGVGDAKDALLQRHNGPLRKSSTFKALSSEHDGAIGLLTEAFRPGGDLGAWKLTDLAERLRRYPYVEGSFDMNEALLDDPGVLGILDKLVIVQASVFVSGSSDCSKTSSFSRQVVEARRELFGAERREGVIRNVVEKFGEW